MKLSNEQVFELVKTKPNHDKIMRGLNYESRLRVMTEPLFLNEIINEQGYLELKGIMYQHIGAKAERTLEFMTFPLNVVNITKDIMLDLYRVFDARNASFNVTCQSPQLQERTDMVLNRIEVRKFIEKEGKQVFKNAPNSFVVVDKDEEGSPYLVLLKNSEIIGYEWVEKSTCELKYLIFKHSKIDGVEKIGFYDAYSYRVMVVNKDGTYTVVVDSPHNLGYCPATPFINTVLNNRNDFNRYNPFAQTLTLLLRWTLFDTYGYYAEHYGTFPIIERAKPKCSDVNCEKGVILVPLENGKTEKTACNTCKTNSGIMGPGTVINVVTSQFTEEKDDSGKFRFISPPTENLEAEYQWQDRRENSIKKSITGINKVMEKEAVNIDQVRAIMEGGKKPLAYIAQMLNYLHHFLVKTITKLETGSEPISHENYGTEWFFLTETDIQKLFLDSKIAGLPESELDELYKLLIETKYKGNPNTVAKLVIENNLNPAPYKTIEECYKMSEKAVIGADDLAIKANFTAFIKRFERENGPLVFFGKDAMLQNKKTFNDIINTIYNTLKTYIVHEPNTSQQIDQQGNS